MVNEFLLPGTINGHHGNNCFCFPCRQRRVHRAVNDTIGNLEQAFLSDSQEYRRLNILFEETKNKIIRGETFRQKCLQNTHYTSFGWWMRTEPRYAGLTDREKKHMRKKVRIVHSVYMHWERIVTSYMRLLISTGVLTRMSYYVHPEESQRNCFTVKINIAH